MLALVVVLGLTYSFLLLHCLLAPFGLFLVLLVACGGGAGGTIQYPKLLQASLQPILAQNLNVWGYMQQVMLSRSTIF